MEHTDQLDTPYVLDIDLDRDSAIPLYRQITESMIAAIKEGTLKPGQRIENEVALSKRMAISRLTARRALQELVTAGLLLRRRGAGTRVAPPHIQRQLALTSFNDDLVEAGHTSHTEVLSYQVQFAGEKFSSLLNCDPTDEVVRIKRLRSLDHEPLSILRNVLPSDVAPSFSDLSEHGLYECFKQAGVNLVSAIQTIGARNATAEESHALNLDSGAALLTMTRVSCDDRGRVIECASHVYDAARYNMTLPLRCEHI